MGFWIGEATLGNEGRALPQGPTPQRLADPRQCQFRVACLVELLSTALIHTSPMTWRIWEPTSWTINGGG
jgi:hypothetical protein